MNISLISLRKEAFIFFFFFLREIGICPLSPYNGINAISIKIQTITLIFCPIKRKSKKVKNGGPMESYSVPFLLCFPLIRQWISFIFFLPIFLPSIILQTKQDVSLESSQPKVNNNENVGK